ncbi:hypothetical protein R3P38DRAFT_2796455 [Favolaschia claudopus]|uniref:Uncharacterized protein n=1 Tax=Favolaschia claudopus TaxID=2862362 RepID=A0AAW0A589_9AGAR
MSYDLNCCRSGFKAVVICGDALAINGGSVKAYVSASAIPFPSQPLSKWFTLFQICIPSSDPATGAPQVKQRNTTEAVAEAKGVAEAVKIRRGGMGFWEAKKKAKACAEAPEISEIDLVLRCLVQQRLYLQSLYTQYIAAVDLTPSEAYEARIKHAEPINTEKTVQISSRRLPKAGRGWRKALGRHTAFPVWEEADHIAICVTPSPEAGPLRGVLV